MRVVAAALVMVVGLIAASAAGAADGCTTSQKWDPLRQTWIEIVRCEGDASGTGLGLLPGGGVGIDPADLVYMPQVVFDPTGGGFCVTFDVLVYEGGAPPGIVSLALARFGFLTGQGLPICPAITAPDLLTPEEWVLQYLSEHGPEEPELVIQPGSMFVGLRAFLETGIPVEWQDEADSPFGPVLLTGTAEITIDWGDDTELDSGPFAVEGLEWPDGEITHVYQWVGEYDVTATYHWSIDWDFGFESGTADITREGTLDDFPLDQAQAVIVRPGA